MFIFFPFFDFHFVYQTRFHFIYFTDWLKINNRELNKFIYEIVQLLHLLKFFSELQIVYFWKVNDTIFEILSNLPIFG